MGAEHELLIKCVSRIESQLDQNDDLSLRQWREKERGRWKALTEALLSLPEDDWESIIIDHRAHRHPWYEQLAYEVSLREYATFFLENWALPSFLTMVERTLDAQICDEGRKAILRNIEDEQAPVPHADLMRRLIIALKKKAGDGLKLETYPSLIDRTLIFHYGYFIDPWHLVGSLFATEVMAYHRMAHMKLGLERLGFDEHEIEFIHIHLTCDEHHARDWRAGVIVPSIRLRPQLRRPIAEGIAACLETSASYLDDLGRRENSF
jgi:hypothetical protein